MAPSTSKSERYFLRTASHPSAASSPTSKYANHYLRHHGGGINAIMVMPRPPKFLRFETPHTTDGGGGGVIATTWRDQEAGRSWGMSLDRQPDQQRYGGWEEARIIEDALDTSLVWKKDEETGQEELVVGGEREAGEELVRWTGWVVSVWKYEHPQLFWTTSALEGELPAFVERVRIVREPVFGQPEGGAKVK